MAESTKRLGRGLNTLISPNIQTKLATQLEEAEIESRDGAGVITRRVAVEAIRPNPNQPRRQWNEDSINELADSIRRNGLIQPMVVRPVQHEGTEHVESYELIAGERRWRAAQVAGLREVPAIVREVDDAELLELALVENIQREDLNAIDRAMAYRQLADRFDLTPDEIAERVGGDRTTVTNYLRLLDLQGSVREMISQDLLSMGHGRALVGVNDVELQLTLAKAAVMKSLSVRALEELVRRRRSASSKPAEDPRSDYKFKRPLVIQWEDFFSQSLGTKVNIQEAKRKGAGKIIIDYNSLDDFDRICEALGVDTQGQ